MIPNMIVKTVLQQTGLSVRVMVELPRDLHVFNTLTIMVIHIINIHVLTLD